MSQLTTIWRGSDCSKKWRCAAVDMLLISARVQPATDARGDTRHGVCRA